MTQFYYFFLFPLWKNNKENEMKETPFFSFVVALILNWVVASSSRLQLQERKHWTHGIDAKFVQKRGCNEIARLEPSILQVKYLCPTMCPNPFFSLYKTLLDLVCNVLCVMCIVKFVFRASRGSQFTFHPTQANTLPAVTSCSSWGPH